LRYAGLINFASQLLSIVTGFLFVVAVTRNLTISDFGIWQNIGDILGYATLLAGVIPFSVTRYVARGQDDAAKTGLLSNIILSIPLTGLFILLAPFFASAIGAQSIYFQVAGFQVFLLHLLSVTQAVVQAKTPHLLGYGTFIYEVTKIALGIFFVVLLGKGLLGAMITVIISQAVLSLFYLICVRKQVLLKVNWRYLRNWWKISFINMFSLLGDRLGSFGLILLILMWGELARAYVGAAMTIAVMIGYSNYLAIALYPKLLAKSDPKSVVTTLKLTMLFAIPMTGGMVVLSESLLSILKLDYAVVSTTLILYALFYLLDCFSVLFSTIVMATEDADIHEKVTIRELTRSRLFLLPLLKYLNAGLYLVPLIVLLTTVAGNPLQAAFLTGATSLVAAMPVLLLRYKIAIRSLPFRLPLASFGRYAFSTVIMMLLLSQIKLGATLSRVLILVLLGGGIYFGIMLVIDPETRSLVREIAFFLMRKLGNRDAGIRNSELST
jgi:O-antigen/teichoic acid export membrane protein